MNTAPLYRFFFKLAIQIKYCVMKSIRKDYLQIMLVFLFFFSIFAFTYFSIDRFTAHDDGFFHVRFAQMIKDGGFQIFTEFPWIYFSHIAQGNKHLVYYDFLFYLFIIPFTFVQPLFLGLKLYATTLMATTFTFLYIALKKLEVTWPWWWTFCSSALIGLLFLERLSLGRPFVITPVLLLTLVWLLRKKHRLWAMILSFSYVFWHSSTFFFPAGVVFIHIIIQRFNHQKIDWGLALSAWGGTVVGVGILLLGVPGFHLFLKSLFVGVIYQTLLLKQIPIAEGGEIYPIDFFSLLNQNIILISLLCIAVTFELAVYWKQRGIQAYSEQKITRQFLFFLTLLFMLGTLSTLRNGDFFVFFAIAYLAVSWQELKQHIMINESWVRRSIACGLIITISYLFCNKLLKFQEDMIPQERYDSIEGAALWLTKNTPQGSVIFLSNWSDFARVFYYNQHNYYIAGLQPRFLYDYNPSLYWLQWNISTKGYVCDHQICEDLDIERVRARLSLEYRDTWRAAQDKQMATVFKDAFHTRYILTRNNYLKLLDILDNGSHFQKVFTSPDFSVYQVI